MITVKMVKNALEKLNHMEGLKDYESFMTNDVKAIFLTKFLNDEIERPSVPRVYGGKK